MISEFGRQGTLLLELLGQV